MESPYSPPVLYLSDDDDDDDSQIEQHLPYDNRLPAMYDESHTRKRRKLSNPNVHTSSSSPINLPKRHRHDYFYPPPTANNGFAYEPNPGMINPSNYFHPESESQSFLAFDWTAEATMPSRIYTNPIHTQARTSFVPLPPMVMNVTKHHLDHSDSVSSLHQTDAYRHLPRRQFHHTPLPSSPPPLLPLPLPKPTSSITRDSAQRIPSGKTLRTPYPCATSPLSLTIPRQTEAVFQPPFRSPSPSSILTPTAITEIRRQPLHGTGFLSAFFDSKCYRCNICKFRSATSSAILQHMFTHMFFCPHCPFYTYGHHSLYQHVQEKHQLNLYNDMVDEKNVDLLYITRCSDGTFALCMDTSILPTPSLSTPKTGEQDPPTAPVSKAKRRAPRRKNLKSKKVEHDDIVIFPTNESRTVERTSPPLPPPPPSVATTAKPSSRNQNPGPDFVFMTHRRCYSLRPSSCSHALTLEYNICREHTIRQMCRTQGILKQRKLKAKSTVSSILQEVARCMKTVVNDVVHMEDERNSSQLICALPHQIINSIFPTDNLNVLMHVLKLNNKHDIYAKHNERNSLERAVRTSSRHTFTLSSSKVSKNDQSLWPPLQSPVTSTDSFYTRTVMENLISSYSNAQRFLKVTPQHPTSKSSKQSNNTAEKSKRKTNSKPAPTSTPARRLDGPSAASQVDRNNNSITSAESKVSAASNVIVID